MITVKPFKIDDSDIFKPEITFVATVKNQNVGAIISEFELEKTAVYINSITISALPSDKDFLVIAELLFRCAFSYAENRGINTAFIKEDYIKEIASLCNISEETNLKDFFMKKCNS